MIGYVRKLLWYPVLRLHSGSGFKKRNLRILKLRGGPELPNNRRRPLAYLTLCVHLLHLQQSGDPGRASGISFTHLQGSYLNHKSRYRAGRSSS